MRALVDYQVRNEIEFIILLVFNTLGLQNFIFTNNPFRFVIFKSFQLFYFNLILFILKKLFCILFPFTDFQLTKGSARYEKFARRIFEVS